MELSIILAICGIIFSSTGLACSITVLVRSHKASLANRHNNRDDTDDQTKSAINGTDYS